MPPTMPAIKRQTDTSAADQWGARVDREQTRVTATRARVQKLEAQLEETEAERRDLRTARRAARLEGKPVADMDARLTTLERDLEDSTAALAGAEAQLERQTAALKAARVRAAYVEHCEAAEAQLATVLTEADALIRQLAAVATDLAATVGRMPVDHRWRGALQNVPGFITQAPKAWTDWDHEDQHNLSRRRLSVAGSLERLRAELSQLTAEADTDQS